MNEQVRISADGSISAPMSYQQAQAAARQEVLRMNGSRRIAKISPLQQRMANENPVFIYNIGPYEIIRHLGSSGTWTVPACPPGKEYSTLRIPGIVYQQVIKNEHSMELQSDDGDYFADQVLGIGVGFRPQDSLLHYGIFGAKDNPPSAADLAKAKQRLRVFMQRKVSEMNTAYSLGPQEAQKVHTPDHNVAARYLGYDETQCPWLSGSAAPATREKCGGCGKPYEVGVLRCECNYVLDMAGYQKAVLEGRYGDAERERLEAKLTEPNKGK